MVTSPRPSRFGGRASSRTTCGKPSRSSAASSIVTTRSAASTKPARAPSVDVFPEPVPPHTSTLQRARTARPRKSSNGPARVPEVTRSAPVKPRGRKRRIVSTGPSSASGGRTTWTREPSGSRASASGSASSARRPSGARIRSIAWRSSASLPNRASVGSSRPPRSTQTGPHPQTITSSTSGSCSSGSSGPRPTARSATRAASADRVAGSSTPASRSTSAAMRAPGSSPPAGSPASATRRSRSEPARVSSASSTTPIGGGSRNSPPHPLAGPASGLRSDPTLLRSLTGDHPA